MADEQAGRAASRQQTTALIERSIALLLVLGLFIGPAVMAVAMTLLQAWREVARDGRG